MDYDSIQTPAACYADFCLIPVRFTSCALFLSTKNITASGLIFAFQKKQKKKNIMLKKFMK